MKLPAPIIHGLDDCQKDWEQLQIHGIFNDTPLGGVLSGTLPNPTLANGVVGPGNMLAQAIGSVSASAITAPNSSAIIASWTAFTSGTYSSAAAGGLTVNRTGLYLLAANIRWDTGVTNRRFMDISVAGAGVNGGQFATGGTQASSGGRADNYMVPFAVASGQTISMNVFQDTAGNVSITFASVRAWLLQ